MRKLCIGLTILFAHAAQAQVSQDAKMNAFVSGLMKKMTIDEKIGQLNLPSVGFDVTGPILSQGVNEKIRQGLVGGVFNTYTPSAVRKLQQLAVENTRLKIPLLFGYDVIHGHKTIFPIPLGLAATWDSTLIEQSAHIAALEATADGLNWVFSPMVDIARDPRWGRVMEGAGEDPYLGSIVARAMVHGYQGRDLRDPSTVMACVKHFALYGAAEAGRDYNTVDMSLIKMYQYYLPPYRAAVDAGAGSIMSSFNEINGVPATVNKWLMTDLLRRQWGFNGFVVTDYTAINEVIEHGIGNLQEVSSLALKAGVDMDMVGEGFLRTLKKSLQDGKVTTADIDLACRRILEAKYKLGLFQDPYRQISDQRAATQILTPQNRQAARTIAAHSFVLLKNDKGILPLRKSSTIALIGPLVDNKHDLIGSWSAAGDAKNTVSVLDGMKTAFGGDAKLLYAKGANLLEDSLLLLQLNHNGGGIVRDQRTPAALIDEAVATAGRADVVVAVVGEPAGMTGEAASRSNINIPENQRELLRALFNTGKPVVLVLMNGRPLTIEWEQAHASGILEAWYPGTEGGNALADVLLGNYNPSGKLTMTFPRNVGQIPVYYNHKNTGRPYRGEFMEKYKSRYLDVSNDPLYPFGFGLSYTHFTYSNLMVSKNTFTANEPVEITVHVSNDGSYDGEETVQLYIQDKAASITQPVEELKRFQKVFLKQGQSTDVQFRLSIDDLKFISPDLKWIYEPGDFAVYVGGNSRDVLKANFTVTK
jgi:beta-glucosidase